MTAQRVCAVEIATVGIESKKSETQRFRTVLSVWKHSPSHENQASTAVAGAGPRGALHQSCA